MSCSAMRRAAFSIVRVVPSGPNSASCRGAAWLQTPCRKAASGRSSASAGLAVL